MLLGIVASSCVEKAAEFNKFYEVNETKAAQLELVESETELEFKKVSLNYPAIKTVTLINKGSFPATIKGRPLHPLFRFFGDKWPGFHGTCKEVINPQESCTITISFQPQSTGKKTGNIVLEYGTGNADKKINITMEGQGVDTPFLYFEKDNVINFGQTLVQGNKQPVRLLKIKYAGGKKKKAQSISNWPMEEGFQYTGSGYPGINGTCGTDLGAAQGSCLIEVIFRPSKDGSFRSRIRLDYSNGSNPESATIKLSGEAENEKTPAVLKISPRSGSYVNFTRNGLIYPQESKDMIFQISKISGNQSASGITSLSFTDSNIFQFKGGLFPGEGGTCQSLLETGSCLIVLSFKPSGVQKYEDFIKLEYLDGVSPDNKSAQLSISGSGGEEPVLQFSGGASLIDFGNVSRNYNKNSSLYYVSLKNPDTAVPAVEIASIFPSSSSPFSRHGNTTCGRSVKKIKFKETCRFRINFKPTEVNQKDNPSKEKIIISYNTGKKISSIERELSGVGSPKAYLSYSSSPSFLDTIVGHSSIAKTIRIHYYGEEPARIISMDNIAPFNYIKENSVSIFPGGGSCPKIGESITSSCTITVQFKPVSVGHINKYFNLKYLNGNSDSFSPSEEISRSIRMRGRGVNPASINALSDTLIFADTLINKQRDSYFTIRNKSTNYSKGRIKSIVIAGDNFSLINRGCKPDEYLNKGSSCKVYIRFKPILEEGVQGLATIKYDNGNNQEQEFSIPLLGKGITSPLLNISLSSRNGEFNNTPIGTNSEIIIMTLTNNGNANILNLNFNETLLDSSMKKIETDCASTLLYGQSCQAKFQFTPPSPGRFNSSVEIKSSNAQTIKQDFSGKGTLESILLESGGSHNCARNILGDLYCWGRNDFGQLGLENKQNYHRPQLVNLGLESGEYITQLALGQSHSCAQTDKSRVKCWGRNNNGQLGLSHYDNQGDKSGEMGKELPFILLGKDSYKIFSGFSHSCSILKDNSMKCWGANAGGQLGIVADNNDQATPRSVNIFDKSFKSAALGTAHSCAIFNDGEVKCWGDHFLGQLGASPNLQSLFPSVNLGNGRNALSLSAGGGHTCAILDDGKIKCWGKNKNGNLGTCWSAVKDGYGPCWKSEAEPLLGYGFSEDGQMGDFLPNVKLNYTSQATGLSSGDLFNCALTQTGMPTEKQKLKCWGANESGQLLLGDKNHRGDQESEMGDQLKSILAPDSLEVKKITTGSQHACAFFEDLTIKCWGSNGFGEAGYAPTQSSEEANFGDNIDENLKAIQSISL